MTVSVMPQWNLQAKCHQYVFNSHFLSLHTQLIQLIKLEQPTQLKSCSNFTDCIPSCFQFFLFISFLKGSLFSKQDVIQKYFKLYMLMWEKLKSKASNGILIQLIFFFPFSFLSYNHCKSVSNSMTWGEKNVASNFQ